MLCFCSSTSFRLQYPEYLLQSSEIKKETSMHYVLVEKWISLIMHHSQDLKQDKKIEEGSFRQGRYNGQVCHKVHIILYFQLIHDN
jgi:hypothetical protein